MHSKLTLGFTELKIDFYHYSLVYFGLRTLFFFQFDTNKSALYNYHEEHYYFFPE